MKISSTQQTKIKMTYEKLKITRNIKPQENATHYERKNHSIETHRNDKDDTIRKGWVGLPTAHLKR